MKLFTHTASAQSGALAHRATAVPAINFTYLSIIKTTAITDKILKGNYILSPINNNSEYTISVAGTIFFDHYMRLIDLSLAI